MKYFLLIFLLILLIVFSCRYKLVDNKKEDINFDYLRKIMVDRQIKARGVKNQKVLDAMFKVKRHLFVPENIKDRAYEDTALPIGHGQTISQPYIVAFMTEALELKGNEKVLEIGTGSGYQAAVLAEIVKEVYSIEIIPELAENARKILSSLGYKNIKIKIGDGYKGWDEFSPYDRIIVTCAPENIPEKLIEQLADGGIMIIPIGVHYQELVLVKKVNGKITRKNVLPVVFVPMIHGD